MFVYITTKIKVRHTSLKLKILKPNLSIEKKCITY